MKKILALLLAVLMLASIGCAWAEESVKPITWQGIPWGSSLEETTDALIVLGLISDETEMQYLGGGLLPFFNENGPIDINEMYRIPEGTLKPEATPVYGIEPQDYIIAGYRTAAVAFNFAFDGENTKLITIYVLLERPQGMRKDEMYDDLALKTAQVYGEGVAELGGLMFSSEETFLFMGDDFTGSPGVMLLYATGNGYALAVEASQGFNDTPQTTVDPSTLDTSGL